MTTFVNPNPSSNPNPIPGPNASGQRPARPGVLAWLRRAPWLLALLLSLPACWPLWQPGFFVSDDGLFHLYRIAALGDALQLGYLYPRWFAEFGFGYGQPTLHFYSPLGYYLASPFLVFGPLAATKIAFALGFILPALAMFALARRFWGVTGALLAALVYTYFPYHLADGLLRGALAEHLAFVWPPLIILTMLPAAPRMGTPDLGAARRVALHALAWAGLILTHHLTSLLFAPVWVGALIFLPASQPRRQQIGQAALALALAGALTAFYWLPVLTEAAAVKLGADPISAGYRDHLLADLVGRTLAYAYRPAPGQPLQHHLGLATTLLLLSSVAVASARALWALLHPSPTHAGQPARIRLFIFAVAICLISAWMLTAPALPLWRLAEPLLARLQYPWRWLSMTAFGAALAAGMLAPPRGAARGLLPGLAGALFIASSMAWLPYQPLPRSNADVTPEQMWAEDAANGQVGATWTAEFLPVTVSEQRWALSRPLAGAQAGPPPTTSLDAVLLARGPISYRLLLDAPQAHPVRLHAFYFPGWQVRINGEPVATGPSGELGLVTALVPAGRHVVDIAFETTAPRRLGGALALLAWWGGLLWLALAGIWPLQRRRGLVSLALLALLPVVLLASSLFGAEWQPQRLASRVGDQALLVGADLPAQASPGQSLEITLYWFNLRDTERNDAVFVHLLDAGGQVRAQHDGDPGDGFSPTTRWRPHQLSSDRHRLALPPDLPPGEYELRVGMYQREPLRNLPVTPATSDDRIVVGRVQVR